MVVNIALKDCDTVTDITIGDSMNLVTLSS